MLATRGMSYYDLEAVGERARRIKYLHGAGRDRSVCRCYLAGPMTGMPDDNKPAFKVVADILRRVGWEVFNPGEEEPNGNPYHDHREAMSVDLAEIAGHSDVVFVMPGWEESFGGWLEVFVALYLNIPVYTYPGMRRITSVPARA